MRRTGCGMRTVRPVSSTTSRKAGGSGEEWFALCAREGAAAHENTPRAAQATGRSRNASNVFKKFPTIPARISFQTKKPHETPGASGFALSREGRWPLRQGRVAWLTAARADHSGGTAADSHGLPRFPGCQLKIQCKLRAWECQRKCCVWQLVASAIKKTHRFFQFGLRFSTRARKPSWESSRR